MGLPAVETCGMRFGWAFSTCWIQPGQQEVNIGSFAPDLTFSRNSALSSMMVRSAERLVSYTTSTPRRRSAVTSLPVTGSLAGMPNSSAMPTRTLGAYWTTTRLFGSFSIAHISGIWRLMVIAPVGQTAAHWPHPTQPVSLSILPKPGATTARLPRLVKSMAPTFWTSEHMRTQRPQRMHLVGSLVMQGDETSSGSLG